MSWGHAARIYLEFLDLYVFGLSQFGVLDLEYLLTIYEYLIAQQGRTISVSYRV